MSIINTLSRAITASQTSIPLNTSVAIFPEQGGVVQIGSEQILYSVASENGLFGCTRGYNSTSAAVAALGATVTLLSVTPIRENHVGAIGGNAADPVLSTDWVTLESMQAVSGLNTLTLLATDPSMPTAGQIWYNTTSNVIKWYNGTAVQTIPLT